LANRATICLFDVLVRQSFPGCLRTLVMPNFSFGLPPFWLHFHRTTGSRGVVLLASKLKAILQVFRVLSTATEAVPAVYGTRCWVWITGTALLWPQVAGAAAFGGLESEGQATWPPKRSVPSSCQATWLVRATHTHTHTHTDQAGPNDRLIPAPLSDPTLGARPFPSSSISQQKTRVRFMTPPKWTSTGPMNVTGWP